MNFLLALVIYIVFMACYWAFVWTILWHLREYTLPNDRSRVYIVVYLAIAITLSVISLLLFFSLPLKY